MWNLNLLKKKENNEIKERTPSLEHPQEKLNVDAVPIPLEQFSVDYERRIIRLEIQVGELMTLLLKEDKYSKTHEKSLSKVGKVLKRQFNVGR